MSSHDAFATPVLDSSALNNPGLFNPVLLNPALNNPVLNNPVLNNPVLNNPVLSNPVLSNPVVKFLQAQIGLEPESLGARVIGDCLSDLARDFPGRSYAAIALSAQHDPQMFAQVVAHFSINESWLFRNSEQFAELRQFVQVRAQTFAAPGLATHSRPLKVLSMPCACGEEPASIAITLLDAGLPLSDFSIVAGDLDSEALAKARTGRFPASAFRGAIPDSRWFEQHDQHYILAPTLLARIEFHQLNVLDPGLFQDEFFDVIFCRNLLIYLHVDARTHVLQMLRRIAAPGALVCTGTAEPTLKFDEPVKAGVLASLPLPKFDGAYPNRRGGKLKATSDKTAYNPAVPMAEPAVGAAPAARAEPEAREAPEPDIARRWKSRLARVEQSANDGDLKAACLRLDQLLEEAPTYAEAWYLRGVLASAQNDLARAEMALDRAAYLDPSHAPTLRLRAELARRGGDNAHADRIRARLKRREGS